MMHRRPSLITVLAIFGSLLAPALAYVDLTPVEVHDRLMAGEDLFVLDVREPGELEAGGHIIGAENRPWSSGVLQTNYADLPTDRPLVVVCRSGGRSAQASRFLDDQGFANVHNMLGGMSAWLWEKIVVELGIVNEDAGCPLAAGQKVKVRLALRYDDPESKTVPVTIRLTLHGRRVDGRRWRRLKRLKVAVDPGTHEWTKRLRVPSSADTEEPIHSRARLKFKTLGKQSQDQQTQVCAKR